MMQPNGTGHYVIPVFGSILCFMEQRLTSVYIGRHILRRSKSRWAWPDDHFLIPTRPNVLCLLESF